MQNPNNIVRQPEKNMIDLKSTILKSMGFGAGFAIVVVIIAGAIIWFVNRPIPWDTNSITAEYSHVDTMGQKNYIVFFYTLKNNANVDYTIPEHSEFPLFAKLKESDQLSGNQKDNYLSYEKPVFIPTNHNFLFSIDLKHPYPVEPKKKQSKEEREIFRENIEEYLSNELSNLNGFTLFDKTNRYQINFENGWYHNINENAK